jgi:hypothetical protein
MFRPFWPSSVGTILDFSKLTVKSRYTGKKFLAFCGTRMFVTVFTTALYRSVILASQRNPHPSHPIYFRHLFILFFHLSLGLLNVLFHSGSRLILFYEFFISLSCCLSYFIWFSSLTPSGNYMNHLLRQSVMLYFVFIGFAWFSL